MRDGIILHRAENLSARPLFLPEGKDASGADKWKWPHTTVRTRRWRRETSGRKKACNEINERGEEGRTTLNTYSCSL